MLKNHLHTVVILATAAVAPLSLEAGKLGQNRFAAFQEDNKDTTAAAPAPASQPERKKIDPALLNLNIAFKTPAQRAEELAAAKKSATANATPASPKEASLNPQDKALLQKSPEACLEKGNTNGSTTTSPLPASSDDKWAEVNQLLTKSASIVSAMEADLSIFDSVKSENNLAEGKQYKGQFALPKPQPERRPQTKEACRNALENADTQQA
ncbi:MAG: hypothetical protein ACPGUZ_02220 [Holosporaceae bacterium]